MRKSLPIILALLLFALAALQGCQPDVPKTGKPDADGKTAMPADGAPQAEEWIAYISTDRETRYKVVMKEIHSEKEITVANAPQQQYTDPRFSLDGDRLRYTEYRHINNQQTPVYWVYDIATGEAAESLEEPPSDEFQPPLSARELRTSHDGKWQLNSAKQPQTRYEAIHALNLQTREFKPLLKGRGAPCIPGTYSWNADSIRYMYLRKAPDNLLQIYVGNILDGSQTQVTKDMENKAMPRWRPGPS